MKKIYIAIIILSLLFPLTKVFASDYTLSCEKTGSVSCIDTGSCETGVNCQSGTCVEACPDPKSHSTKISDTCEITYDWNCSCAETCQGGTASCNVSGDCSYDCDEGYHYEGGNCILTGVANWIEIPLTFVDDLKATVGEVASDLWVLIALVIGLPLAFWVIRRAIGLVRARG